MELSLEQFGIDRLSPGERLELIGLIQDSLTEAEVAREIPDWHRRELDRRLADHKANPEAASPWEAVKARLKWRS